MLHATCSDEKGRGQGGGGVPLFPYLFQFISKKSELFVKTKNAPKTLICKICHIFFRGKPGVPSPPVGQLGRSSGNFSYLFPFFLKESLP